jgi:hypothetical protein
MLARSYVKLGQNDQARGAFVAILHDHPDWRPDPDKVPPDEIAVFETALDQVRAEAAAPPPPPPAVETPAPEPAESAQPKAGKSIFKRWWFYAILGGAAAGAAIALSGGGDEEAGGPLPDFPAPPQ